MTTLADVQRRLGVTADGVWGPRTAAAMLAAIERSVSEAHDPHVSTFASLAIKHLRAEEGCIPHAYQDHLGYWTIGVGRLIDQRRGGRLTDAEIDLLLSNDIVRFVKAMEGWPSWQRVRNDPVRAVALLSMCFQLGVAGLSGFTNTLGMIARGDFGAAATNMLASKWAEQTPARAKRVAAMMRTGRE